MRMISNLHQKNKDTALLCPYRYRSKDTALLCPYPLVPSPESDVRSFNVEKNIKISTFQASIKEKEVKYKT
jgi:hypothetical protein